MDRQPPSTPSIADRAGRGPIARAGRWVFAQPYLLLTFTVLFWSGNFVLGRAVEGHVPPVALAFWRWTGGLLIVLTVAVPQIRRDLPAVRRHWRILLLLSALGVAAFNTLIYSGLQFTEAINALLMQSVMPVIIVIFTFAFFREAITLVQGIGVALSLVGASTIITRGDLAVLSAFAFNRGDLLIFIAVVCYAGYSALLRLRPVIHPLTMLAVTFAAGSAILLPVYVAEMLAGYRLKADWVTAGAIGYVAIFPSIIAYMFFNRGVDLVGANRAGMFMHLMPVFGSLMAMGFLGERLAVYHGVGLVLILGGIVLASRAAPPGGSGR